MISCIVEPCLVPIYQVSKIIRVDEFMKWIANIWPFDEAHYISH